MTRRRNGPTWRISSTILLLAGCILAGCADLGIGGGHGTGCIPSPPGNYPELAITIQTDLPVRVDLADLMPPVGHQHSANSCVGWATAYYLKSAQEGIERHWGLDTLDHQFSPSFVYNQRSTSNCTSDRGMSLYNGLRILENKGCLPLSEFPYSYTDLCTAPDDTALEHALSYRIEGFATLFRGTGTANIARLKTYLAEGNPFVTGIPVYSSYMTYRKGDGPLDLPKAGDEFEGGHAILVVGYDDTMGNGCFKFVNSWGTRWGIDGYGYLTYDFLRQKGWEAWAVTDYAPQLPKLMGPATERSGVANDTWQSHTADPDFTWEVSEQKPGIVAYAVYFGPDSGGTSTTIVPEPAYDPPAVSTGTYYLRVSVRDNTGSAGPWETLFVFRYREPGTPTDVPTVPPTPPTATSIPTETQQPTPVPPTAVPPTVTPPPTVPPVPTATMTVAPTATASPTVTNSPPTLAIPTTTAMPTSTSPPTPTLTRAPPLIATQPWSPYALPRASASP